MHPRAVRFQPVEGNPPSSPPHKVPKPLPATTPPPLPARLSLPVTHLLERLPPEVCEQIAAYVSAGAQTDASLHLAELGPAHSAAVVRCLEHKFSLPTVSATTHPARWARVLQSKLVEIDITCPIPSNAAGILGLLSSPSLRAAAVTDEPSVLQALSDAQSRALCHLRVRICHEGSAVQLFQTLARIRLTRLTLTCCPGDFPCPFRDRRCFTADRNVLARVCPLVKSLEIDCDCGATARTKVAPTEASLKDHAIWRILPGMPVVKDVRFRGTAPVAALPMLQTMASVRIVEDAQDAYALAIAVGKPVTEISSGEFRPIRVHTEQMVRRLTDKCPRLRVLAIKIEPGAEMKLAAAAEAGRLRFLKSLWLHWTNPSTAHGAALRIVQGCQKLANMQLTDVAIEQDELEKVLQNMGERLRRFETAVVDQKEPPLVRLEALLYIAARHNRKIRALEFDSDKVEMKVGNDPDMGEEEKQEVKRQAGKVLAALRQLHRRAPYLDQAPVATAMETLLAKE